MSNGKKGPRIVCHSEDEFEELFLPRFRERKRRERGLSEPVLFGEELGRELRECLQRAGEKCRSARKHGIHE